MNDNIAMQLFEGSQIRIVGDAEVEKCWFSIVDVVQVLTESADGRKYWNKLKQRFVEEGNETVTNCHQLKLPASDGKNTQPMLLIWSCFCAVYNQYFSRRQSPSFLHRGLLMPYSR